MKHLLIVTAAIEVGAGLALLLLPSAVGELLLNEALETPVAVTVGRLGGAGLLSLGVSCWLARHDKGQSVAGLVTGMLLYNIGAVGVLAYGGIRSGTVGIALWPAVGLHATMAVWCIACLRNIRDEQRKQI